MTERKTENLVLTEMNINLGENDFGHVFEQGDVKVIEKIEEILKKAGGKPKECDLSEYNLGGNGKAQPEYIITFNKHHDTIIVIECKPSVKSHQSEKLNQPKKYAVDGVLYYAKFLKQEYNVIAIAVSGLKDVKVSTFYWQKGLDTYTELSKGRDILYDPINYINLINGKKVEKQISIEEIRKLALIMHENLRSLKMTERAKPVFIAGILIALKNKDFLDNYSSLTSFSTLLTVLQKAINDELSGSDIPSDKIEDIKTHFKMIGKNAMLKEIPLGHYNSLLWYIEQLENKIKPMMDYSSNTVDALGIFYHEFVKYSGGDGSGLGIVLTPQHLTEFMADLAEINKSSKVVDICCGSGAFLVTAMSKMFIGATEKDIDTIKKEALYGVESNDDIYTLAIANMIVRGDGKSNIIYNDCFKSEVVEKLKQKNINIGLINPPYSQKDYCELEFVENMLNILTVGGTGVVVVPMSCAIGTKFREVRERLFKNHTLKAVFSMPDDIFYSNNANTNVCVMVWEAHKSHNSSEKTFFGYYKDDGFVKAKKLGRIDKYNKWENIKKEWLNLYREKDIKEGLSAKRCVTWQDEWLCEAYMETDYSKLTRLEFEKTVKDYLVHLVSSNYYNLYENVNKICQRKSSIEFDVSKWKSFKVSEIFDCKTTPTVIETEKGQIPYVTRTASNNGVDSFVTEVDGKLNNGNCITIGAEGRYAFYQPNDFISGVKIYALRNEKLNKYNALFICTLLNLEVYRYNYGRARILEKIKDEIIKLPVDGSDNPDWRFMEDYIKTLSYSDLI